MSAGEPNWQKLHAMGKLPKEQRGRIPMIAQLDAAENKVEEIKAEVCDACRAKLFPGKEGEPQKKDSERTASDAVLVERKCPVEGCEFVGKGKLPMHAANALHKHEAEAHPKEDEAANVPGPQNQENIR